MDSGFCPVPCSIALAHRLALNIRSRVTVLTVCPVSFFFWIAAKKVAVVAQSVKHYVLQLRSLWIMLICCHFVQHGRMRAVVSCQFFLLCFQGRISCYSNACGTHAHYHKQTSTSPVTYLFNWQAKAFPALVTHFSHPPVECVCLCVMSHLTTQPSTPNKQTQSTR